MRVIQVVPSIDWKASGLSYSVPSLSRAVARTGASVTLHVLEPAPDLDISPATLATHKRSGWIRRLGISRSMRRALAEEATTASIIHSHSLWMMPCIYPARAAARARCLIVSSPRGTLDAYAVRHHRWRKRAMWLARQGRALRRADCLHATAEAEADDFRRAGLLAPVAVIPNGVDVPPPRDIAPSPSGRRRLLFIGRLHPKKGIDLLLRAWGAVHRSFPEWDLCVAGEEDFPRYLQAMKDLAGSLGAERVEFPGVVSGERKSTLYFGSDLFALPTRGENFALTVAEALAHGVPAIVSKAAPWQGLESRGCGWWIEEGAEPLAECLRGTLSLPREQLQACGKLGRAWMEEEFSWDRVGAMMRRTYDWVIGGGDPPDWVRRDG